MPTTPPLPDFKNTAKAIREIAARATDPAEKESLLQSAQKVDAAHRKILTANAKADAAIEQSRALVESIQKRRHLPDWVVVLVLCLFFALLALVTVKHHI
jgi:hypothetical protein